MIKIINSVISKSHWDFFIVVVSSHINCILFIFQAHHNHQDNTAHGGHMLGVCHNISVEVFDSVMKQQLCIMPFSI